MLWRRPFPQSHYEKMVLFQREVMRSLFLCDVLMTTAGTSFLTEQHLVNYCLIDCFTSSSGEKAEKHHAVFVTPLYNQLDQLEAELILVLSRLSLITSEEAEVAKSNGSHTSEL